jgi:chromosome partitioning protein
VKEYFGDLVFKTVIQRNIKVEEANDQSVPLYEYAPNSAGAKAYEQLVQEVIERAR